MSTRKKSNNFVQRLLKQIWRFFDFATKAIVNRLLRSLLVSKRQSRLSNRAGFVLPTVVMMILVVTLLTTAIMIRSFDRSKNASNVRVDQAVLNAATPALDRARAKIDRLFSPKDETRLSGSTPSENDIYKVLADKEYQLGDETRIELTGKFPTAPEAGPEATKLNSAWKFPVDTDNNGKFDTYTLYGIYFRNPLNTDNDRNRPRGTIEARALPQDNGQTDNCSSGASPTAGWYPIGGQLKKAFFTYVANVPITDTTGLEADKYESYTGNKGFSALEMQLDQARSGLDSNAVWYQDDIALSSIPSLRLNGRVHTNSNLLVKNDTPITFLQVSSANSCFYNPDNAKIVVGGNVAAGDIGETESGNNAVTVDLFVAKRTPPINRIDNPGRINDIAINSKNKTTTLTPSDVAGNSDAYAQRLGVLVQAAIKLHDDAVGIDPATGLPNEPTVASVAGIGEYPKEDVIDKFTDKMKDSVPGSSRNVLKRTLETYFADRIRRVSFAEVGIDDPQGKAIEDFTALGPKLQPPIEWMEIKEANTQLPLNMSGPGGMQMPASDPGTGASSNKPETEIGDRVLVGNNLPNRWWDEDKNDYAKEKALQNIPGVNWVGGGPRKRKAVVETLDDIADTSRDGFWEVAAAQKLQADKSGNKSDEELSGGLRIVTGAGIYVDGIPIAAGGTGTRKGQLSSSGTLFPPATNRSFLPEPSLSSEVSDADKAALPANYTVVWPDTMPMYQWDDKAPLNFRNPFGSPSPDQYKGDLQMRATVVYHYASGKEPIACVSSYYDPTDPFTADNANNISNNGKSYSPPTPNNPVRLRRQSRMVTPDGRLVNPTLYYAMLKLPANRSFSEKAAVDAANCALNILDGTATLDDSVVPNFAIQEKAFLDARQIKAIHRINRERDTTDGITDGTLISEKDTFVTDLNNPDHLKVAPLGALVEDATTNKPLPYNLPFEQRQPLEVRVTEIDLNLLRKQKIPGGSGQEYLLPNSGIIYATRDDALPDISCANDLDLIRSAKTNPNSTNCANAATDFELDPTRRPNGIRLINGKSLERDPNYRKEERGLILASNVPVYIKGDFNLHAKPETTTLLEEFTDPVTDANFYTRSVVEKNFACRAGSPNCSGVDTGDQWRAARILSDAITILSDEFRDGYRYEGDYDLNNNAGNLAVESFLDKGFWANSYATTAQWYGTDGYPRNNFPDDSARANTTGKSSSYVMNSVTPIQRRVNFPTYKMEICEKLPVSECGPGDWKVSTLSGDTSTEINPALPVPGFIRYRREHYPRRVAFERDATGQLILDNGRAKPILANGTPTGLALNYPLTTAQQLALDNNKKDNALWFATTSTPDNPSALSTTYSADAPLYYAPEEAEDGSLAVPPVPFVHERQFILPGTPSFPKEILEADPTLTALADQTALNGQKATDPSDYAICTQTQSLDSTGTMGGPCTGAGQLLRSRNMAKALLKLVAPPVVTPKSALQKALAVTTLPAANPTPSVGLAVTAPATAKVNVFDLTLSNRGQLPNRVMRNVQLTLDRGNQSDPIFVFRTTDGTGIKFEKVTLELGGVDPNKIFWIPRQGGVELTAGNTLMGNFIGTGTGNLKVPDVAQIKGGARFLGFSVGTIQPIELLKTTAQPLLVPVLQLHSPSGQPGGANDEEINTRWLPKAKETKVNAVLVMGDSPSRPLPELGVAGAEYNGGLANFPRFLEAWSEKGYTDKKAAKIFGGFIQFKRSAVATAPFETITDPKTDTALFFDTSHPAALSTLPPDPTQFKYLGGASGFKAAYYTPPDRQWGYDVGLLSQTPDLYAQRFTPPEPQTPSEYFREVSRDDAWVNTLLCAKEVEVQVVNGEVTTSVKGDALPPGQRPNCQ